MKPGIEIFRLEYGQWILTFWSPSPSEDHSLLTFCVAHAWAQLVPIYLCTYCNVHELNSALGCMEAFVEQRSTGAAIWGRFVVLLLKKKKWAQSPVCSHVAVCSMCCRCAVRLDFRVFRKKRDCVVVSWLQSSTLHTRVLQTVPHKAKLFVNIGNLFGADFFPVNFHSCFNNFFYMLLQE